MKSSKLRRRVRAAFAVALCTLNLSLLPLAQAHEGRSHPRNGREDHSIKAKKLPEGLLVPITESYISNVEPIFKKSCFDCHSSETKFPWYSSLPFAKQLIENDIAEARKHLDMSNGIPFAGHGTLEEDLKAIRKSVESRKMPPFRYRVMHPANGLTEEEIQAIVTWADTSLERISKPK